MSSSFGPRTRTNVQLTSKSTGRTFVLPLEIFLPDANLRQWWGGSQAELLGDVLRIVEGNSHVLSRENISTEGGSISSKRKKGEFDRSLRGKLLESTWEIRETQPKATIMTFNTGSNPNSGFSLIPTLPVTLLLWPVPLDESDEEVSSKITSYFTSSAKPPSSSSSTSSAASSSKGASSRASKKSSAKREQDELDEALRLSLAEAASAGSDRGSGGGGGSNPSGRRGGRRAKR